MFKVGLIGIPIETVPIHECWMVKSSYLPGITDEARKSIRARVDRREVDIDDLGEMKLGPDYSLNHEVDRLRGVPQIFSNYVRTRDMDLLESGRKELLSKKDEYDLLLALGPSHLGGIVLYEESDIVARMDHHADYSDIPYQDLMPTYASYMNWVENNIEDIDVTNYFVHYREFGELFGREGLPDDDSHVRANHFDIDVDCFDPSYRIQDVYPHEKPSGISPSQVLEMIRDARPDKIGIWEYRLSRDYDKEGLSFIAEMLGMLARP